MNVLKSIHRILRSVVRSLIFRVKFGNLIARYDIVPLIFLFSLYLTYLVRNCRRTVRSYQEPSYLLELYINEASMAKTLYMLRSLIILRNVLRVWGVRVPLRIMDLGCGIGTTFRYLKKLMRDSLDTYVILCDVSPLMLYTCKLRFRNEPNIDLVLCDAQHLPFRDNVFNIITSYELLEHLERPVEALKKMLSVANKHRAILHLNYDIDWPDPLHIAPYTRTEFENVLWDLALINGFRVYNIAIPEAPHNPLYIVMTTRSYQVNGHEE